MKRKNILRYIVGTALILSVPLVAMQFSDEWDWKLGDFVIIGTLLLGSSLLYEAVASKVQNKNHRVILGIVFVAAILLIWAELAVGLFGTPFAGS